MGYETLEHDFFLHPDVVALSQDACSLYTWAYLNGLGLNGEGQGKSSGVFRVADQFVPWLSHVRTMKVDEEGEEVLDLRASWVRIRNALLELHETMLRHDPATKEWWTIRSARNIRGPKQRAGALANVKHLKSARLRRAWREKYPDLIPEEWGEVPDVGPDESTADTLSAKEATEGEVDGAPDRVSVLNMNGTKQNGTEHKGNAVEEATESKRSVVEEHAVRNMVSRRAGPGARSVDPNPAASGGAMDIGIDFAAGGGGNRGCDQRIADLKRRLGPWDSRIRSGKNDGFYRTLFAEIDRVGDRDGPMGIRMHEAVRYAITQAIGDVPASRNGKPVIRGPPAAYFAGILTSELDKRGCPIPECVKEILKRQQAKKAVPTQAPPPAAGP